jgi:uncharacterized protein YlxW (UPF0749 family)
VAVNVKRIGDFIFWTIIAVTIVYIFWPTTSIIRGMLKIFLALLLFGMAYAEQLQRQFREVEARLAELENHNSELKEHVAGRVDSLKHDILDLESKVADLKTEQDAIQGELGELRTE